MLRFIIVSFAFLGWSFYVLSGGADYRPSANSIQARAMLDNQRPKLRPLRINVIELAQDVSPDPDAKVTRTLTSLHDLALSMGQKGMVTLASAEASAVVAPNHLHLPTVQIALPPPVPTTPNVAEIAGRPIPADEQLNLSPEIGRVSGHSVNLRAGPGIRFERVTNLKRDTKVIILSNPGEGWIKLRVAETGHIGWMAENLMTRVAD